MTPVYKANQRMAPYTIAEDQDNWYGTISCTGENIQHEDCIEVWATDKAELDQRINTMVKALNESVTDEDEVQAESTNELFFAALDQFNLDDDEAGALADLIEENRRVPTFTETVGTYDAAKVTLNVDLVMKVGSGDADGLSEDISEYLSELAAFSEASVHSVDIELFSWG